MINILKKIYIFSTGYSYTNMGRLFLRLFVGLMLMQFGIRQLYNFSEAAQRFPEIWGMDPVTVLIIMIIIEVGCSFFIMVGFCTRIMCLPPMVSMIVSECYLLKYAVEGPTWMLSWADAGYLPMMFMGIYFFILLVGPGKISVDYFLSLYIIHTENKSERELEEV